MDLALYARVIWRFRLVVLLGLLLAIVLSTLSFVRVTFKGGAPGLAYRQAEVWQSVERLLITQRGFAEGWTNPPAPGVPSSFLGGSRQTFVGTDRFAALALYYEQLANSDSVQRFVHRDRSLRGSIVAQHVLDPASRAPLPVLDIGGFAGTPEDAIRIARRGAEAFRLYLEQQQIRTRIPTSDRVHLSVLNTAKGAQIFSPRKKTLPIVVFLTVMIAAVGLAFILENLRPRMRLVEPVQLPGKSDVASSA
jgi:hypothetical protein